VFQLTNSVPTPRTGKSRSLFSFTVAIVGPCSLPAAFWHHSAIECWLNGRAPWSRGLYIGYTTRNVPSNMKTCVCWIVVACVWNGPTTWCWSLLKSRPVWVVQLVKLPFHGEYPRVYDSVYKSSSLARFIFLQCFSLGSFNVVIPTTPIVQVVSSY
jgi:hypothetical protein